LSVAYDSIQTACSPIEAGRKQNNNRRFYTAALPTGDAYQFDCSHETAIINGEVKKIKVAHLRLSYSRKFFLVAYFREAQEMLLGAVWQ